MATLYLIHGFTGAGKTTFARKLQQDSGAVRFSPDEWMVRLYGQNPPAKHFQDHYNAIDSLIRNMTALFLVRDHDVIWDMGFWSRSERDTARSFAADHRAEVKLYALTCPEDMMRKRVLERTAHLPFGGLVIDKAAFELFKSRFEPLHDDEEHTAIDTSSAADS